MAALTPTIVTAFFIWSLRFRDTLAHTRAGKRPQVEDSLICGTSRAVLEIVATSADRSQQRSVVFAPIYGIFARMFWATSQKLQPPCAVACTSGQGFRAVGGVTQCLH